MSKIRSRTFTLRQYGHLYSRIENVIFEQCWYCGDTRECLDHVPSLGVLEHIDVEKFRKDGGKFLLVPSCTSCNSLLANRRLFTPNERISWLLGAYHKLFDKSYYGWSDAEVKEMGYGFRVIIKQAKKQANSYIGKIRSIERRILDIADFETKPNDQEWHLQPSTPIIETKRPPKKRGAPPLERSRITSNKIKQRKYLARLSRIAS